MSVSYDDIGADLLAYLEGEANPATADRIAKMLAEDAGLQKEADNLRRLLLHLDKAGEKWRRLRCPVDLMERLECMLPKENQAPEIEDALTEDLKTIGRTLTVSLPSVDVLADVMAGVKRMKRLTEEMPVNAEEALAFALLEGKLEDLGEARKAAIPPIDIVDQVMKSIPRPAEKILSAPAPVNVVPFRARPMRSEGAPQRSFSGSPWIFRVAAALFLCTAIGAGWWTVQYMGKAQSMTAQAPGRTKLHDKSHRKSLDLSSAASRLAKDESDNLRRYPELARPMSEPIRITLDDTTKSAASKLSLEEVLAAKKDSLQNQDAALAKLLAWSSLTPEEAKRLLQSGDISMEAFLGALQYVTPEEAAAFLRDAVQQYPENPYLRYLLARNLATNPDTRAEAIQQLAAMKEVSPDNALPYYMEARMKLDSGDINGALMAMDVASNFETASAFGLNAAQAHSAALTAAGYDESVAQFLAAATAGRQEYGELTALGQDLLAYGRQYEDSKDYETANSIYESVQQLGEQVKDGATLSNEQLAGYDLEMAALDAVSQLAEIFKTPEGQDMINLAYGTLSNGLTGFISYLGELDNLFLSSDAGTIHDVSTQILNQGDLTLNDYVSRNTSTTDIRRN